MTWPRRWQRAGAGHGQVVALVGEAGVGKSRLLYEFVHSHRTQGWLVLEAASVSYGKATPVFPGHRPAQALSAHRGRGRAAHRPGQSHGAPPDPGRGPPGDHPGAAGAPGRLACRQPLPDARSTPAAATHPRRAQAGAAARKPGAAPAPGLRGPALDRRRDPGRCSTVSSRACRRPASCCWSTTARSISTAGAARPTTRNCGSTRCRRRAPTNCCRPSSGTTPASRRSSHC